MPEEDALALTNFYRSMHHATPVALNRTLSVDAQKWAEGLARGKKLIHQENNKDGENLAKMASGGKSLLKAINAWYDEMGDYNYKIGKFGANTGHFTQVSCFLWMYPVSGQTTNSIIIETVIYPSIHSFVHSFNKK